DSSASMLQIARANLAEAQLDQFVALIDGDFLDPDLTQDERYGAVIIAIDSLLHATSAAAQIELLRVAHRNLAEGGILLVDILHPTPGHLLNLDSSLTFAGTWSTDDGSKLDKLVAQSTDIAEQIIASEIWYEVTAGNGTVRRVRTAFEQRWIGSGELELMLQIAGFTRWQIYGSYELDPLDASSNRMIVAAEKPRID
ncbi:MAG: class I SAM-dependent methyltransferase, partial [Thermomicrobiales bacterium]|nr:class I SAM-dependent methyltransferase [Thermomicrobiales bacterium]